MSNFLDHLTRRITKPIIERKKKTEAKFGIYNNNGNGKGNGTKKNGNGTKKKKKKKKKRILPKCHPLIK